MKAMLTQDYAGFWQRFLAAFIDGLITTILSAVAGFVIGSFGAIPGTEGGGATGPAGLVGFVLTWLYYALMESSERQATFGKLALGLRVTDLEGNRISFGRATVRYFAKILSAIILLIGYIMAAFTEKKQALHDMLAGTLVLRS